ncbi:MAG: acetate kinase [Alistipes sp.]|nr:acetate kinase [Alistipes sp.]
MIVLVLNCGSSSIKYQVIDINEQSNALLAKGLVDRIGLAEGSLTHKPTGKEKFEKHMPIADHTTGISLVLEALTDAEHGVIANLAEVKAVGHRVAHGGEFFKSSVVVDEQAKENIRSLFEIAPLHNPANLEGILSIEKVLPGIPQVAVFDTSFHQTIPAINYLYALPYEYYDKYRVRKYGFHGTSHKYVAKVGAELTGLDFENSKIITCHIGNGGSITAVLNGKSYDTSMGFSPLDGLVMGTRCGQVDASAVTYIGEREGMNYAELNSMMNKKSGVYGMTGISSDMRDIDAAYKAGNEKAIVARDMYYNRVKKFVAEYAAEMGGVDLVIFTGGVGENSSDLRRWVCKDMEFMGIKIEDSINDATHGDNAIISTADAKVKVAVIATNEELVIATDTYQLTKNL